MKIKEAWEIYLIQKESAIHSRILVKQQELSIKVFKIKLKVSRDTFKCTIKIILHYYIITLSW